ncbi:MAG: hypothetical protein RL205_824 [Actinomycetota bacterium]|jgi:hypothetical protein
MPTTREFVVRLDSPEQLFTASPVSPMSDAYTEFTAQPAMETVRDLLLLHSPSKADEVELILVLPDDLVRPGIDAELTTAVRRWIRVQNTIEGESTQAGGAVGRRLFVLGVITFFLLQLASITVRKYGDTVDNYAVDAVAEGLGVISWVMLWFPVQIFTVEAWRGSIRRRRATSIERMTVQVTSRTAMAVYGSPDLD